MASRPWFRWTAALVFGAIVLAVAGASFMRNSEGSESVTLPDGRQVKATSEDEALIEGFMAGCKANYTSSECVCLSDAVFVRYSVDEFKATVAASGIERGIAQLIDPIRPATDGCFELSGISAARRTAPEILAAVRSIHPDFCLPPFTPLEPTGTPGLVRSGTKTLTGPSYFDDQGWLLNCYQRVTVSGSIDGQFSETSHGTHICFAVDDESLTVTLLDTGLADATDSLGVRTIGTSCVP